MINKHSKIILPGGAGLVGQNLIVQLKNKGYSNIWVIDKHQNNLNKLKKLHPEVHIICDDLSQDGSWKDCIKDADAVVMLQAQIGGNDNAEFKKNNIDSTKNILDIIKLNSAKLIHISSSVVNSKAKDYYSESKRHQEDIVIKSGIKCPILRPTLMFGWFDRKHLGWLSRFMSKIPIFPIPGNGKYIRQPLYVGDFCKIIMSCIESEIPNEIYDISGQERVYYIDIIKQIKKVTKSKSLILKIPYRIFYVLLSIWSIFDKNPPFTTQQLEALVVKEEFDIINWPDIFSIKATPFDSALHETFCHPVYSSIEMEF
ncbi:MAG: NAD-dependent epimerase/dehydratase family protein [Gammaproteobacteria bacterium]